jgi:hypothetical protein
VSKQFDYRELRMSYVEISKLRRIRKQVEKLELMNSLKRALNQQFELEIPLTLKEDVKKMKK